MLSTLPVALFLAAHALIHTGYISPRPKSAGGPEWPFALDRSWFLTRLGVGSRATRIVGLGLLLVLAAAYGTAIGAALGLGGGSAFAVGTVVGSGASLALLALFFHPWLVIGIALDAALLFAVLAAGWTVAPLP